MLEVFFVQSKPESTGFLQPPYPHTRTASLLVNILPELLGLSQLMGLHIIFTPSPQFPLGLSLGIVHPMGLAKSGMTCSHHYSVRKSILMVLNIARVSSMHLFTLAHQPWQPMATHDLFTVSTVLAFR